MVNFCMSKSQTPSTISDYIDSAPPDAEPHLKAVYRCLQETAPGAEETIKWGVPAFSSGTVLFTFAAFKRHINFYPTPSAIRHFISSLSGFETGKSSIKFPHSEELPTKLIREIAEYRLHDVKANGARWM